MHWRAYRVGRYRLFDRKGRHDRVVCRACGADVRADNAGAHAAREAARPPAEVLERVLRAITERRLDQKSREARYYYARALGEAGLDMDPEPEPAPEGWRRGWKVSPAEIGVPRADKPRKGAGD